MKGKPFLLEHVLLFITSLALFSLSGCATAPTDKGEDWETWRGQLTGMVDGDLEMAFGRFKDGDGVYRVKGRFDGDIENASGGYGSGAIEGAVEGKFKDGIFDLHLSGQARSSDGPAPVHGKMIGTLSQTTAFGTWHIVARGSEASFRFSGQWRVEREGAESAGK